MDKRIQILQLTSNLLPEWMIYHDYPLSNIINSDSKWRINLLRINLFSFTQRWDEKILLIDKVYQKRNGNFNDSSHCYVHLDMIPGRRHVLISRNESIDLFKRNNEFKIEEDGGAFACTECRSPFPSSAFPHHRVISFCNKTIYLNKIISKF